MSARRRQPLPDIARVLGAVAGAVLAHAIDFVALFPAPGERARTLAATGHGSWHLVVVGATAAAVAAVALTVARGVRIAFTGRTDRGAGRMPAGGGAHAEAASFRPVSIVLLQLAVFGGMESLERLGAGVSPVHLLHERAFLAGLGFQVVVGAAVAVCLWAIERLTVVVASTWRARSRRWPRSASGRWAPAVLVAGRPAPVRLIRLRGPPAGA